MRLIAVILLVCGALSCSDGDEYTPREGDILFQSGDCGSFCRSIQKVTQSYEGMQFTHNGLAVRYRDSLFVLEAGREGVVKTPIDRFLNRHTDENGVSKVAVGRMKEKYRHLIPGAVKYAEEQLGKPYNSAFLLHNDTSFYCAELIYKAFEAAAGDTIFVPEPMTFKDPDTDSLFEGWAAYFDELGMDVPEGAPGVNPGLMSLSDKLEIVYIYR